MDTADLHVVVKETTAAQSSEPLDIVCLHGWGQSHKSFLALAELLTPYARLHLVDLPGFGDSPPPPEAWGTQEYAERVLHYMDSAGIRAATVIAHSFGGRVALRLTRRAPGRVSHLVLMGAHGLKRERTALEQARVTAIQKSGRALKQIDAVLGTTLFEKKFVPRYGSRDYRAAGALRGTLVKTVTEDQSAELPEIAQPTLLIWGALDTETPVQMGRRFNALLRNSELIVLDGRGHDCFMDIDAHLCGYYIKEFLTSERAL